MSFVCGDVIEELKKMPDNCFHGCLTDVPYELGFMNKKWDQTGIAFNVDMWKELYRVLKPGSYLLSFGGTRTFHRIACAIEDARFIVKDTIMWIFSSGFPKAADISKHIDRMKGLQREVVGQRTDGTGKQPLKMYNHGKSGSTFNVTESTCAESTQWEGYKSCLKPAYEPIIVAQKPCEGTIAANCLKYGTGALNIENCRVPGQPRNPGFKNPHESHRDMMSTSNRKLIDYQSPCDRFPANIILENCDEVKNMFPNAPGQQGDLVGHDKRSKGNCYGEYGPSPDHYRRIETVKNASRFFYTAKVSQRERNAGLEMLSDTLQKNPMRSANGSGEKNFQGGFQDKMVKNTHPTLKPISLTTYLAKLILPPIDNSNIIIPFAGTGSEVIGAVKAGWHTFTAIEKEKEYVDISEKRYKFWITDKENDDQYTLF